MKIYLKKILLLMTCILFLASCNKKGKDEVAEPKLLTYEEMNSELYSIGMQLIDSKDYLKYEKPGEGNSYFVSLKSMKENYNIDVEKFINPDTKKPCNQEEMGIVIDTEHYYDEGDEEYPILIRFYCE